MDKITKSSVYQLHQQFLNDGNSNLKNTELILNIFGGIDRILADYLSVSNNAPINQTQLNQIHQLITTPQRFLQKNKTKSVATSMITNQSQSRLENPKIHKDKINCKLIDNQLYYHFDEKNCLLYSLFNENTSDYILKIFRTKIIQYINILGMVVCFIALIPKLGYNTLHQSLILLPILIFIIIPYQLVWLLSANKIAFKIIIKSLDFWIKIFYSNWFSILSVYLNFFHHNNGDQWKYFSLRLCQTIFIIITSNLFFCIISSLDSFKCSKKWKIALPTMGALFITYMNFEYQIKDLRYGDTNYSSIKITNELSISLLSMLANTTRIVAIFLWKQSISAYIAKHGRCNLIRHSVIINWNKSVADEKQNIDPKVVYLDNDLNEIPMPEKLKKKTLDIKEMIQESEESISIIDYYSSTHNSPISSFRL